MSLKQPATGTTKGAGAGAVIYKTLPVPYAPSGGGGAPVAQYGFLSFPVPTQPRRKRRKRKKRGR
jgi:hypothetical protein